MQSLLPLQLLPLQLLPLLRWLQISPVPMQLLHTDVHAWCPPTLFRGGMG